jgi:molybdopterin-guanine dinucleotide biosynthesis protein A
LAARNPFVAIVACDMPFDSPSLFEHERDLIISTGADVVIPSMEVGLEPLHTVYRRATCLPVIQAEMEAGERKVMAQGTDVTVPTISWLKKFPTRMHPAVHAEQMARRSRRSL